MKKTWIALALLIFPLASFSAECNFREPHSLACQKAAFDGTLERIFRNRNGEFQLVPVSAWADFWSPNQFTAANDTFNNLFTTFSDRFNRHRTCGIQNQNGNFIHAMTIRFSGRGVHSVDIEGWTGDDDFKRSAWADLDWELDEAGKPKGEKPLTRETIIFALGDAESFRCRVFLRTGIQHLSCEYFKDGKFAGYVGFLPMQDRPDCR